MGLLTDKDLVDFIKSGAIKLGTDEPADWYCKDSPVQPSSIDLHVGKIYTPEVLPYTLGGIKNPMTKSHSMNPGETILVETKEALDIPDNYSGFGFPPASLAVMGILMTNPGHIDPGFKGRLHFTCINMGKRSYTLHCGAKIFTTLWIELANSVESDFFNRNHITIDGPVEDDINVLSKDFLIVDKRAEDKAREIAQSYIYKAGIIALVVSILGFFGTFLMSNFGNTTDRVNQLSSEFAYYKSNIENIKDKDIVDLQSQIKTLSSNIRSSEDALRTEIKSVLVTLQTKIDNTEKDLRAELKIKK